MSDYKAIVGKVLGAKTHAGKEDLAKSKLTLCLVLVFMGSVLKMDQEQKDQLWSILDSNKVV